MFKVRSCANLRSQMFTYMKCKNSTTVLFFIVLSLFSFQKTFSQCFEIESILVDACAAGTNEGYNEMVRFKTGPIAQNSANLVVTWPNNSWLGVVQNTTTAAKVATLNATILAAGGCRRLIEPPGGIIPANASVILVTSYLLDTALNSFGALTSDIYIIFQNNGTVSTGHFANTGVGIRTLIMTFGGTCSDSVSYDRALLTNGAPGAGGDGATVLYTTSGAGTYVNNGCVAPVPLFTVDAGTVSNVCQGATITLSGSVQGHQSVAWSALNGSFSAPTAITTNYTVGTGVTGTVVLTLSATNTCGVVITDSVTLNVAAAVTPTFTAITPICSGAILSALPTTSNNSVSGTWSPALNNLATTVYTFAPAAGQCAVSTPLTITINPNITPTFTAITPICSGAILSALPTTSNNSVSGTWSPALNNLATTTYSFAPAAGQCAINANLTVTVQAVIDFTVSGACDGNDFVLTMAPVGTPFNPSTSFSWQNSTNSTVGTNDLSFNVSNYLYLSSLSMPLPQIFRANVTDSNGCIATKPFTVTSLYCSIQKGISPNGDGDNEFFDLSLLDVKALSIFNRYGIKVYSKSNYRDEWRGETNGGNQLPHGTYYYVIELNSNNEVKTGWVYINK